MSAVLDYDALLKNANIDTIVPSVSDLDVEDAVNHENETESLSASGPLHSISQRQLLFFDELVIVHVVLRVKDCSEEILKDILPRLTIKVDVLAVSSQLHTQDGKVSEVMGQTSEIVFSDLVKDTSDPLIVVHQSNNDGEAIQEAYAFWKLETFLNRPRTRLQNFSMVFVATATLSPPQLETRTVYEDEYLPSLTPSPINLLEFMKDDENLGGVDPHLPNSRLVGVSPSPRQDRPSFQIRGKSQNRIRVVPAVSARIRYSRLNTFSSKLTTIASLDFEVTPLATHVVSLEKADLQLTEGKVEKYDFPGGALDLPVTCSPRDDITFLYKLTPEYGPDVNPSTTAIYDVLEISLESRVLVSEQCKPRILMRWKANVDFSMPVNPTFGGPSQGLQRNNRPASIPVTPTIASVSGIISPAPVRPPMRSRAQSITDLGVTITFSGPENVEVGKTFFWEVFIVNHSPKARKLSLLAIPKRKRGDTRKHASKTSSSSISAQRNEHVAEAIADENIVYAMQKNGAMQGSDLICITTEVRIGSLQPGSCHSMDLKFLPLAAGVLHLEAVRVADALTNEATDIRDLPDIIASHRESEG